MAAKAGDAQWRRWRCRWLAQAEGMPAWQDLEKLLEGYGGCTEYDVGDVPKMVVDSTGPVEFEELCSNVLQFVVSHAGGPVNYHESSNII